MSCRSLIYAVFVLCGLALFAMTTHAASFQITPTAGSYGTGQEFTTTISVNTEGTAINAAEGVIRFDTRYLTVESISINISIFKFWVQEPAFSNAAGTISFSGGLPTPGYNGANGKVLTIRFLADAVGESSLKFTSAAILANDGFGTNVLSSSQEARYKISFVAVPSVTKPVEAVTLPPDITGVLPINPPVVTFYSETFNPPKSVLVVAGTALPDVTIMGLLRRDNNVYAFERLSDTQGNWSIVFKEQIPAGDYILTVQAQDSRGALSFETYPVVVHVASKYTFIISIVIVLGFFLVVFLSIYLWPATVRHRLARKLEHFKKRFHI